MDENDLYTPRGNSLSARVDPTMEPQRLRRRRAPSFPCDMNKPHGTVPLQLTTTRQLISRQDLGTVDRRFECWKDCPMKALTEKSNRHGPDCLLTRDEIQIYL